METLNFKNLIFFENPRIIDRNANEILLSFETIIYYSTTDFSKGECCFLFNLKDNFARKWIHREISYREGISFVDPSFSADLYHSLSVNNLIQESTDILGDYMTSQIHRIPTISIVKCFN